ncbi:MAG: acyl-CoA thioesterase [bacterium]|nr:acyl-CoA thioesterase [bacterium]
MVSEFVHRRLVEFSDTDLAGIVHWSRYFVFMESCEHAFYRSVGWSVHRENGERTIALPRGEVTCRYAKPLKFEDEVEIHLFVREIREKTIRYEFQFRRVKPEPVEDVARALLTVVCVGVEDGRMKSIPIPEEFRSKIEIAS